MKMQHRYPGARPFETGEEAMFFGREQDVEKLQTQLRLNQMLVLYAKSGLGKSSLLNAGLLPRLEQEEGLRSFSIRFQAYQPTQDKVVLPLDRTSAKLHSVSPLLDRIANEQPKSLWYLLKSWQLSTEGTEGAVLVFDQFEELFTYPTKAVEAFAQQLAALLYTTIPDHYRKGLESKLAENPDSFTATELELLHQPIHLRFIMAIRSDRYSLLDRLKPFVPDLLASTYELKALGLSQAEDAILNPAYEQGVYASPTFDFEDQAIDHLINFLSQGRAQPIESFQLQILCEYIERKLVVGKGKTQILETDLVDPQQILEGYYFDKLSEIADPEKQLAVRKLIEEGMVFEQEERRLSLYEGQIENTYGVSKELLNQLVANHLIRAEPSLRGGYTYELSHDTLVGPILKAKAERVRSEEEKQKAENERQRMEELREEREQKARARTWAFIMSVTALLALVATGFAFQQYRLAKVAQDTAEAKQEEAEENLRQRIQLETQNILREAEILEQAGQMSLARKKLEEGLQRDSTNNALKVRLNSILND